MSLKTRQQIVIRKRLKQAYHDLPFIYSNAMKMHI